jgi:hypothetical protein
VEKHLIPSSPEMFLLHCRDHRASLLHNLRAQGGQVPCDPDAAV